MSQNRDFASWRVRGAAYLIDCLIPLAGIALFRFGVLIAANVGMSDGGAAGFQEEGLRRPETPIWLLAFIVTSAVVCVGYFAWWLIALKDGQTPGKKIVGIRAVRADTGETLEWGMTFAREFLVKSLLFSVFGSVLFIIITFSIFGGIVYGLAQAILPFSFSPQLMVISAPHAVNLLRPLWDDNDQTLHDEIVRSRVVYN